MPLEHRETGPTRMGVGYMHVEIARIERVGIWFDCSGDTRPIESITAYAAQGSSISVGVATAGKIEWGSSSVMRIFV